MKFDKIIREAGFRSCQFPKCSQIEVKLYDDEDNISSESDIHFSKKLFADNPKSATSFFNFLCFLEKKPVMSMNVEIDEHYLIVFYKSPQAESFRRTEPMDPIDYMD